MNTKADVKVYCLHHLKEEKPSLVLEMTASEPLCGYLEHVWISPLQILLVLLDLALLLLGGRVSCIAEWPRRHHSASDALTL